jgi:hypothetical protein
LSKNSSACDASHLLELELSHRRAQVCVDVTFLLPAAMDMIKPRLLPSIARHGSSSLSL